MIAIGRKVGCGVLAALMVAATAQPAEARHRRHRADVDAGDVIGAAVVLGGIAAILSASKRDRDYGGSYGAERKAVRACVREAERGYGAARVRDVTDVQERDDRRLLLVRLLGGERELHRRQAGAHECERGEVDACDLQAGGRDRIAVALHRYVHARRALRLRADRARGRERPRAHGDDRRPDAGRHRVAAQR